MIILDSDVLSALMRPEPDFAIRSWMDRQPAEVLWTTAITVFEIREGIQLLPEGRRKEALATTFAALLGTLLVDRILSLDTAAADRAARLSADRGRRGLRIGVADTLIAGIALSYDAQIATGNWRHFQDLGARVVNPWRSDPKS